VPNRSGTFLLLIFLCLFRSYGQNLVPNAGFEAIVTCPTGAAQLFLAAPWDSLGASPDLFNACATGSGPCFQPGVPGNYMGQAGAHTGDGYAGIVALGPWPDFREYLQAPLNAPLKAGALYRVQAWFRRASYGNKAVRNLGIALTAGPVVQFGMSPLGFIPQVESDSLVENAGEWTSVGGFVIAFGGENNIVIGNFMDDASTDTSAQVNAGVPCPFDGAYYYVDDVRIEEITESVHITGDTVICPGGTATLQAHSNSATWWSVQGNPGQSISRATTLTVSPSVTTTYYLNGFFQTDSITVVVIPPPVVSLGPDTAFCEGSPVVLDASNPGCSYTWSTGSASAAISPVDPGVYWVLVANAGCSASDTIVLTELPAPPVDLGTDSVFCSLTDDFVTLDAGTGGMYQWSPLPATTQTVEPHTEGSYHVVVTYGNGCSRSASISMTERCQPLVFIPRAFTPNGDGNNDVFTCPSSGTASLTVSVYSRWGQPVFSGSGSRPGWDGTVNGHPAPAGTYGCLVTATFVDEQGTTKTLTLKGFTTLLR